MADKKKFALVTGCGQGGIGEALVKEYARQGLRPIATVLPKQTSDHLVQAGIEVFALDVTREASVLELKGKVAELTGGGGLDVLVNNAGVAYTMTAIDTDVAAVQAMFDVNVLGPMRMIRHFHDLLINASGTIVNIGSVGGIVPYVYASSYNATKAALHHWSNTLRVEMAPLGVRVITVISGEIGTNILQGDVLAERALPPNSYYAPLADDFKKHIQRVPKTTSRYVYAEKVVAQSLRASPSAWFWYGATAPVVRFLDTFGWRTIWDSIFSIMFGLGRLRGSIKARKN